MSRLFNVHQFYERNWLLNRLLLLITLIVLVTLFNPVLALAQDTVDPQAIAQAVIDNMIKRDFEAAGIHFGPVLAEALSAEQLEQTWDSITTQVGAFQQQTGVSQQQVDDYVVVVITLQFEKAMLDAQLSIASNGQIDGFYIRPSQAPPPPAYEPPSYLDPDAFYEQDIVLNAGTEWELPATLTLPVGDGLFPVVILVHGSGPQDRDETIGPNRPFRDLAWGLASHGIAVLRYDKRTLVHGQSMAGQSDLTVQDETINDALAAIRLLMDHEAIDSDRIFLLGHSLGGYLAPRIAAQTTDLAGEIILAGNARPLDVLTLEQVDYLLALDGELSPDDQAQLDMIADEAAALQQLDSSSDLTVTYFGVPAAYWLDLQEYDPVIAAQTSDLPLLILQGERDYQVTMVDFAIWQEGLADRENVTFISYPDLNHLFLYGEGQPNPAEYQESGHVAEVVIQDIVDWILME